MMARFQLDKNGIKAISERLKHADIVLLLISIDFINSYYCYEVELEEALELHYAKKGKGYPRHFANLPVESYTLCQAACPS